LHGWVEIVAPVPLCKSIEVIKAAGQRMVRPLGAVMPLAEESGGVASRPKDISNGLLAGGEAFFWSSFLFSPSALLHEQSC
jgi:hypothetical protein